MLIHSSSIFARKQKIWIHLEFLIVSLEIFSYSVLAARKEISLLEFLESPIADSQQIVKTIRCTLERR